MFLTGLDAGKSKVKVPTDCAHGEEHLSCLHTEAFLAAIFTWWREIEHVL